MDDTGINFEIVPYKAVPGFYIRATWPNGRTMHVEDLASDGPAFRTRAEAQAWIANPPPGWFALTH